jgi:hypothetical protein
MKHITDPAIRCKADEAGADTYTAYDANRQPVSVLTFSQKCADWLAINVEPDACEVAELLLTDTPMSGTLNP